MVQQQIGRRATDQGSGETEWVPCPTGTFKFEVDSATVKLSRFKSQKGDDQYSVGFAMKLTETEYERAKEEYGEKIEEGQELSGRVWYTCGLTLGWIDRTGTYQTTRLADFLVTLLGSKQQKALRAYIVGGGGPTSPSDATIDEQIETWNGWFDWFVGCCVWGTVTHRKDAQIPGKVWADFGGPIAVGQRPGPADPDYEAFGRGKLRMVTNEETRTPAEQGVAAGAAEANLTEADFDDDEEATLLRKLEEARARKAGTPAVDHEKYAALFGEQAAS